MTLQRQLLITIFGLFLCLFIGTLTISSYLTRTYLDKQLTTHAQDAATSLGLLLSPHMQQGDKGTMVSIIDAVFDRGYYDGIKLFDMNGKLLVDRKSGERVYKVPDWFIGLMKLTPPQEEAEVINGWQQAGKITVQSNPGHAYQELWATSIAVFIWFLVLSLILFMLGVFAIHCLLKPLRAIGEQAKAITEGQFPIQDKLPKTTQLRAVAIAMNRMTEKLKKIFKEQSEITANLRRQVYHDSVTDLYNRTFLENYILHHVTLSEDEMSGVLFLIQLDGLQKYNEINGFLAGDTFLKLIANSLRKVTFDMDETICCRLSGASFVVIALHLSAEQITQFSTTIRNEISLIAKQYGEQQLLVPYVAITHIEKGMIANEILSDSDVALRTAHESTEHTYDEHEQSKAEQVTDKQWSTILSYILKKDRILLYTQAIFSQDRKSKLYSEILLRARDKEDHIRTGGIIFPMAQRLNLAADFDKAVLTKLVTFINNNPHTQQKFSVNLTLAFLENPENINWLLQKLTSMGKHAKDLVLEISEEIMVNHLQIINQLNASIASYGTKIGIDQFGRALSSFAYLLGNRIAYVKIDGCFIRNIDSNTENQTYIQSLVRVAHSIDILVMADKVENEREFNTCIDLGIDAAQGIYLESPQIMC